MEAMSGNNSVYLISKLVWFFSAVLVVAASDLCETTSVATDDICG